jgi:2-polyprenyl-6-methoxyphenol hydroxylase-like FAD-dependent oxidoreductase
MPDSAEPAISTDVLIVGGGPVGLAMACELGWQGVSCIMVDEGEEHRAIAEARINLINIRSMEFCRRWGIEEEIKQGGFPADYPMTVLFATSMRGKLLKRLPYPSMADQPALEFSPTNRQRIPQHLFDPVFRRAVRRFSSVQPMYGTRFEALEQFPDHVEAVLVDLPTGKRQRVRARYLIACDGAKSAVRDSLGIDLQGERVVSYSCGIYFRSPELWKQHDKGKAIMHILVDKEGMWANLNMIDGRELWRLSIAGGSEYVAAADIDAPSKLRRALGGDFPFEVLGVYPWARRAVVARTYRKQHCFLVGDSAHQLSPTGGFGMNTGMGDAVDLGWKLAATLKGWGGEALLDSYDAERRPIGERNVREATLNFRNLKNLPTYSWIDDAGAEADARRAELGERFAAATRQEWESDGVQLGYRYDESPIIVADGTPPPPDSPSVYTPSARPGGRAPHVWMAPGRSTLDLFGRGFVLLEQGADENSLRAIQEAAAARGVPLSIASLNNEASSPYQRKLTLVRPDGHVAWRGDRAPENAAALVDVIRGAVAKATPAARPGFSTPAPSI